MARVTEQLEIMAAVGGVHLTESESCAKECILQCWSVVPPGAA